MARSGAALIVVGCPLSALADPLPEILRAALRGTTTPAVGALAIKAGKVQQAGVYGVRRLGDPERVQISDPWLIGSCTKPMTATLIARLVDQDLLSWQAPLSRMLPDLVRTMRPDYRSVTLLELLSHRSGLPLGDESLGNRFLSDPRPLSQQRLAFVALGLEEPPVAPPGTSFSYSNIGFIAAAAIAERVTGVPYEQLMRREIFGPLRMASAGFGPLPRGGPVGHIKNRPALPTDSAPPLFGPAGFVRVSLDDWAKFCVDQLAGAKGRGRLLTAASYHLLQSPQPGTDAGLDWGVDPSLGGRKGPVLSHTGSEGTWFAIAVLFPVSEDGILVVANAGESMGGEKADKSVLKSLLPDVSTPV